MITTAILTHYATYKIIIKIIIIKKEEIQVTLKTIKPLYGHFTNYYIIIQGGPIKTVHFLRYHIFAATTDIIMWFFPEVLRDYSRKQQATIFFNEC